MGNLTKNIFFKNYICSYIHINLCKKLLFSFLLSVFLLLQHHSISYAMHQDGDLVEQQDSRKSVTQKRREDLDTVSYDEEEIPLLSPNEKKRNKSWKQNWFIKNVIAEFPVIGDFFHDDLSILGSLKRAGKSTSMLLGGSIGMMMGPIPVSEHDDMAADIPKGAINMAIGMWAAVTIYNTVLSLGEIGYNCIKQ